jgi:hypothetical protein
MTGKMSKDISLIPTERIERSILLIRGQKIMLDRDLAYLYGVTTKVLNQAVKRHKDRFPEDFMFQLTMEETRVWWTEVRGGGLRSQIVTLKRGQHIKYRPYAFTPLESPAIYTGDDIDKSSIPFRKGGKALSFLTG